MKKFLITSLAAVSLLGLAACNEKKDDGASNAPAPATPAAPSNNGTTTTPSTPARLPARRARERAVRVARPLIKLAPLHGPISCGHITADELSSSCMVNKLHTDGGPGNRAAICPRRNGMHE